MNFSAGRDGYHKTFVTEQYKIEHMENEEAMQSLDRLVEKNSTPAVK